MPEVKINYDYTGSPTLKDFALSPAFIRCVTGPFGSGKSSACVMEIIRRAHEQDRGLDGIRRTRWAVVRNTYTELRDTTIKTFHDWLPPGMFGTWHVANHDYQITAFKGVHIEVLFRALDNEADVKKLLSMELTGAWLNECREIPWAIVEAITGRVGRYPAMKDGGPTWYGVFMDTNPPDEESEIYKIFEEERPENALIFRQPSGLSDKAENKNHLVPGYYENLSIGKSEEWKNVYVHGKYGFIVEGQPVYPEYNDVTHCKEREPIPGKPIRRGWDFGLTPACSFSQIQANGQWVIFDEIYAESLGITRFSGDVLDYCARKYAGFKFDDFGDPAGNQRNQVDERTCFDILRAKGIQIQAGEQSPLHRLESVRKSLTTMVDGEPMFVLHPRCKRLRKGFMGGYHYPQLRSKPGELKENPEKNVYSHIHDALQYDATRLFGPGIVKRPEVRHHYGKKTRGSYMSA